MKNKNLLIISKEIYFESLPKNALKFIIDGSNIKTEVDFLKIMSSTFDFPKFGNKICNLDGFLDWMRDLSWFDDISCKNQDETVDMVLIIKNYSKLFNGNMEEINFFVIENFIDYILPYWEKDVLNYPGVGTRKFDVYLIEDFEA